MHFSFALVACLLGTITALPVKRDAAIIEAALKRVSQTLSDLDGGMKARPNGGDFAEAGRQTDKLLSLQYRVVDELRSHTREIRRGPDVGAMEAVNIVPALNSMATLVQSVNDGWSQSAPMVVAARKKDQVLNTLLDVSEATTIFSDAIIAKLPYVIQVLATPVKSVFISTIEKSINQYKALKP